MKLGVSGITVTEVRGHGKQKGHTAIYRGNEYAVNLLPKMEIEIVVPDALVDEVVKAITHTARTPARVPPPAIPGLEAAERDHGPVKSGIVLKSQQSRGRMGEGERQRRTRVAPDFAPDLAQLALTAARCGAMWIPITNGCTSRRPGTLPEGKNPPLDLTPVHGGHLLQSVRVPLTCHSKPWE
jgi:hypothetical protein